MPLTQMAAGRMVGSDAKSRHSRLKSARHTRMASCSNHPGLGIEVLCDLSALRMTRPAESVKQPLVEEVPTSMPSR